MYSIQIREHEVLQNDQMYKMNETQKKRYEYITAPATVIAAFVGLIWVIVSRVTLNNRVAQLEEFRADVNIVEIQTTLKEIQVNIAWIQKTLSDMTK